LASRHSYGEHPSQFCELHPGGEDVAVLVHGGFWRARYGLDLERELAADLVARGWTVWNIEYRRLGDGGGWPQPGADVVAAIAALPVAAARIVAIGHSAGGHLATWASAHTRLDGVVSQAGALDLYELQRRGTSDNVVRQLLGGTSDEVPEQYEAATPRPPAGMPLLLVHGTLDEDVPVEISRTFGAGELVEIEDEGHMEHLDPASRCWRAVIEWL
jgi:dipeptidyl aminopeptidase/acylaminoacyl peptidase